MSSEAARKKRVIWNENDELLLLELWAERAADLRSVKRNGFIYKEMAEQMGNKYSPHDMHVKVRNLQQKYRQEKNAMEASSGSPSPWKFYNSVHRIISTTAVKNAPVSETFVFEYSQDKSHQLSSESEPLPSPVLTNRFGRQPSRESQLLKPVDRAKRKKNNFGELVKIMTDHNNMIREHNTLLKTVVEDTHTLSTLIAGAIREQNDTAKQFITLMQDLIDKI